MRELCDAPDRPYVFHLGAQAHVGESWHRPYETVMANTSARSTCSSRSSTGASSWRSSTRPAPRRSTATSATTSPTTTRSTTPAALILHERSPINPKSIYATAKVAADFLTMNYHDAFGLPGVVTRMFNNYGPRQNPRYVTGTIVTQALTRPEIELGALDPLRDFCFCTDGVRGHLMVAAHGRPGDVYVYGQGENISMADWADLIVRTGVEHGFWPDDRRVVTTEARKRPGSSDVMALRVGHEKLTRETGWQPRVSWEEGVLQHDPLVCRESGPLDRPGGLAPDRIAAARHGVSLASGRAWLVAAAAAVSSASASGPCAPRSRFQSPARGRGFTPDGV